MTEKVTSAVPLDQLPLPVAPAQQAKPKASFIRKGLQLATLGLFAYLVTSSSAPSSVLPRQYGSGNGSSRGEASALAKSACQQPPILTPTTPHYAELDAVWKSGEFKNQAIDWLSGAVQIETESYDAMGHVGEDDRWKKFQAFHDYLEKAFPRTHAKLGLTKVNTYGLVFEWKGSDPSLKPVLLMGHQDVVPVEKTTYDQWQHPPFSGHYDGEFIWGRGSVDDKSGLIGAMSAVESILGSDFAPKRTIVLAFGFDEEVSGGEGASHIAPFLEKTYGRDSFALILDEGGGYQNIYGTTIAALGVGEKGYNDVRVSVKTLGGHSSVPPESGHTSIGYLSLLIAHLEANPHPSHLTRENPFYSTLVCAASHGDVGKKLDKLVKGSLGCDKKLHQLETELAKNRAYKALIGTTQAVDLVSGGIKVNALPELSSAVVNHRINVASSASELQERITKMVAHRAKELNLTLSAFGEDVITGPGDGQVVLEEAFGHRLEPAPITPTTPETKGWNVLAGSIKETYRTRIKSSEADALKGDEIVASPAIMSGNTDTKFMWNLSSQIYRYNHLSPEDFYVETGIHSVNEALRATAFVNNIRALATVILNVNEHDV